MKMFFLFLILFFAALGFGIYKSLDFSTREFRFTPFRGSIGYILAVVFFLLMMSFTTVDAGTRAVVTRFGNVNRTLEPGAHLLLPFAESTHAINVQTQTVKPAEDASSNDLQVVHTEVTLAYHYDPAYASFVYQQLNSDAKDSIIVPAILEGIKSRTAQYSAADLIAKRPLVRDGIEEVVKNKLAAYHIVAETVSITDFHFSKDYEESIEAKVTAVQKSEKAQNDLARIKIEAEQKIAAAEGEAAALKAQKSEITPELLQLRTIEMMQSKWDGHLPENYYGGSAPLPMVDVFKKK